MTKSFAEDFDGLLALCGERSVIFGYDVKTREYCILKSDKKSSEKIRCNNLESARAYLFSNSHTITSSASSFFLVYRTTKTTNHTRIQ